jgi:hypothetical protein
MFGAEVIGINPRRNRLNFVVSSLEVWLNAVNHGFPINTREAIEKVFISFEVLMFAPHAMLTPELAQQLETEKAESTRPPPLQLRVIEMFSPVSKE